MTVAARDNPGCCSPGAATCFFLRQGLLLAWNSPGVQMGCPDICRELPPRTGIASGTATIAFKQQQKQNRVSEDRTRVLALYWLSVSWPQPIFHGSVCKSIQLTTKAISFLIFNLILLFCAWVFRVHVQLSTTCMQCRGGQKKALLETELASARTGTPVLLVTVPIPPARINFWYREITSFSKD